MVHSFALVLGGGGSTANAWEIGVIAGLSSAGLDVTASDLIIGTSAGSTVAAQITATRPTELLANIVAQTAQTAQTARHGPALPNPTEGVARNCRRQITWRGCGK